MVKLFIELTDNQSGVKVSFNTHHICKLLDAGGKTIIWTIDGKDLFVRENYDEVMKKITTSYEQIMK